MNIDCMSHYIQKYSETVRPGINLLLNLILLPPINVATSQYINQHKELVCGLEVPEQ